MGYYYWVQLAICAASGATIGRFAVWAWELWRDRPLVMWDPYRGAWRSARLMERERR